MENLHELRQIFLQILNEEQGATAEAESDQGNLEAKGSMSDYKKLVADHAHQTALGQEGNPEAVRMAGRLGRNFKRDVLEAHLNHLQDPNLPTEHVAAHRSRIFDLLGGKKKAAMQTASTDYSRLMLRSLFEALYLMENPNNMAGGFNAHINPPEQSDEYHIDSTRCPHCGEDTQEMEGLHPTNRWCDTCNNQVEVS